MYTGFTGFIYLPENKRQNSLHIDKLRIKKFRLLTAVFLNSLRTINDIGMNRSTTRMSWILAFWLFSWTLNCINWQIGFSFLAIDYSSFRWHRVIFTFPHCRINASKTHVIWNARWLCIKFWWESMRWFNDYTDCLMMKNWVINGIILQQPIIYQYLPRLPISITYYQNELLNTEDLCCRKRHPDIVVPPISITVMICMEPCVRNVAHSLNAHIIPQ